MWTRITSLFQRNRLDRELAAEIDAHLAFLIDEKRAQGMSDHEAALAAKREFGGITQAKEAYRDRRGIPFIESVLTDAAYALRLMRRNVTLTAAILGTLTLGIGTATAVFTIANAILLQPLRIPEPDHTVMLLSSSPKTGQAFHAAEGVFVDWRKSATAFDTIAGCWSTSMILRGAGQPYEVNAVRATADFFALTGLKPIVGRTFDRAAEQPGKDDAILISEGLWEREYGRSESILGRKITLDDRLYTVVGVLPSGFALGDIRLTDAWLPLVPREDVRGGGSVAVFARLRNGVSITTAQAEMDVIHAGIVSRHQEDSGFGVAVKPLREQIVAGSKPALLALSAAVLLLLLVCCINIANLLLARAVSRQREFAIRATLGGGGRRLARQVLIENSLLGFTGGAFGLALAAFLIRAVPHIRGLFLPRIDEVAVDWRMFIIAVAVTVTSSLLVGLAPAWRTTRTSVIALRLKSGAAAAGTVDRGGMRLQSGLVVAQLGLSVMLLCGAGLLMKTFVRLVTTNVGFSGSNVISANVRLPYRQYNQQQSVLFHRRLMDEVAAMPGVEEVSASDYLPLQAVLFPYELTPEGSPSKRIEAMARNVAPKYFSVLRIPLLAGREFETYDDTQSAVPVVLNEEAAQRFFGDPRSALGKRLTTNYKKPKVLEVIGIAANVRQLGLKRDPGPQLYLPQRFSSPQYTIARLAPGAPDLTSAIRAAVLRLDRSIPVPEVSSANTWFEYEIAKPRAYAALLAAFAALAVLLAAVGVYGVVAYGIARRTHEFGVRMAIGASRRSVFALVITACVRLVAAGCLIGLAGGFAVGRALQTLLFEVRPDDSATLASASAVLISVAMLACVLAARRIGKLEPTAALRYE